MTCLLACWPYAFFLNFNFRPLPFILSPLITILRSTTNFIKMKRLLLAIALLSPVLTYAQRKKTPPSTYDVVIGTYTTGKSKGIYVYRFYTETGRMAYLNEVFDVANPSYLTVSANNKFIYAVNETGKDGGVSSFSFEPRTGKIVPINKQPSGGADPCYISVDKAQKNAFVANYSSGTLAVLPIDKDGSLGAPSQVIHDEGTGPDKSRQEGPHVHISMLSPDEKYLLSTDLGTDKLNIYRYRASAAQPLTPASQASVSVKGGNGPRHIEFSPNKKQLYLLQEMGSTITAYDYKGGKLKEIQSVNILYEGFKGAVGAAAIHISPDGNFLYATNRGDANEIVIYSINPENGQLTYVDRHMTYGKAPRDFAIDPTGNFLLVANQNSDSIYVLKRDQTTGKLTPTGMMVGIGNPVCLKFTPAE